MKRVSRILPFVAAVMLLAQSVYGQNTGAISGRVVDRDGTTPLVGATIQIDSLITERGQLAVRERLTTKTGRDGSYSQSGLYAGRLRVTVIVDNVPVMIKGEATGDEIFLANGLDARVNFDLSKAPAAPPAAAVAAPGGSDEDRAAARARFEKEARDAAEMQAAFEAGKTAFAERKYEDAITNFKLAAEKDPKVHIIWANLARSQDAAKQYDDAVASYQKAIELQPDSNYYLNMGVVQFSSGKVEDGTASIKKAVELNPANAGLAYYNLGATLVNRGKSKEAADAFTEAIKLDPNYANAYYELAVVKFGSAETIPEAVPLLDQYLKLAPTGQNADAAKALIEAAKATSATTFQAPKE